MPRPSDTSVKTGADSGYGPDNYTPESLQVTAPLNVTPPQTYAMISDSVRKAGMLARSLNVNLTDAKQKADAASAQRGAVDAELHRIDPDLAARDSAYRDAARDATVEKNAQQIAQQSLEDFKANPQPDLSTQQVLQQVDQKVAAQFNGLDTTDPKTAAIIAKYHSDLLNNIGGQHLQMKQQATEKTALEAAGGRISTDIATTGTADYAGVVKGLAPIMGMSAANDAAVSMYIQEAHARSDTKVLDMIPSQVTTEAGQVLPGPGTVPHRAEALKLARDQITAENDKKNATDLTMQSYHTMAHYQDLQTSGQKVPEANIQQSLNDKLISGGAALQLHARNAEIDKNNADVATWQSFFASGNHWSTTSLTPDDVKKHMDTVISAQPIARQQPLAMAFTMQQGLMPTSLSNYLSTPAQQSTQGLQQQLHVYAQLRANAPAATINAVPEKSRAIYDRALQLSKTGEQPAAIIKDIQDFDPEAAKASVETARPDINKAVDKVSLNQGKGSGWMPFGLNSANASINDYQNAPQVKQSIREQAELLVGRGFSAADAATQAAKNVTDSSVSVKTPQGYLLIPRTEGVPADVGKAVDYLFDRVVPEVIKGNSYGFSKADVRLSVQPGADGKSSLVLVGPNGETVGSPFTLQGLYGLYMKGSARDKWEAGQAARSHSDTAHRAYLDTIEQLSTPGAVQ